MSLQSYAAQYRNTGLSSAVMEADPHRLVALLLAGACERLRLAFAGVEPAALGLRLGPLSLSVGMTLLTPGDNLDTALHRADQALYRAKRGGRDRCLPAWEVVDA